MSETGGLPALASRTGLPPELLYLREAYPRDRWTSKLDETAAFWLQMHASFRGHQAHMDGLVSQWRASGDAAALHRQLIPALQSFLQHLDGHHRVESGQYFPMMRQIEPRIGAGIDLLDRDHDAIHETLEALFHGGMAFHQAVAAKAPDAADTANRLSDLIDANGRPLLRHLEDEEDIVIPLIQLRGCTAETAPAQKTQSHESHESQGGSRADFQKSVRCVQGAPRVSAV